MARLCHRRQFKLGVTYDDFVTSVLDRCKAGKRTNAIVGVLNCVIRKPRPGQIVSPSAIADKGTKGEFIIHNSLSRRLGDPICIKFISKSGWANIDPLNYRHFTSRVIGLKAVQAEFTMAREVTKWFITGADSNTIFVYPGCYDSAAEAKKAHTKREKMTWKECVAVGDKAEQITFRICRTTSASILWPLRLRALLAQNQQDARRFRLPSNPNPQA